MLKTVFHSRVLRRRELPVDGSRRLPARALRQGNVLVLLAIMMPVLIGLLGLVLDGGLMMDECRALQHAADAAATEAAFDLRLGMPASQAEITAANSIHEANQLPTADVTVHIPPISGAYAGTAGYVEVIARAVHRPRFMPVIDGLVERAVRSRSVAGVANVTTGAAVIVLDPDPADLSVPPLSGLPALPTLTGGLEIIGVGHFAVDGAVLVNNTWGGVDENGEPAGAGPGPPYGVSCTPVLPLTQLSARDIRVVGGVDDPDNYSSFPGGGSTPLQANRLPVADPYENLPAPTTTSDPDNVSATLRGGVTVAGLPLIGPPVTLQPGIYEYISVVSGVANFQPGVYIIRGVNPTTQVSLSLLAGTVNAQGVLFYVTNSAAYDGTSGAPDDADGESPPASPGAFNLSVVIQAGLLGTGITSLTDAGSPYDGLVIYQRRQDRRPIVVAHQNLIGNGEFSGTVYAKWGHVVFAGNGTYDARFVCGTLRVLTIFNSTLAPSALLPPARDVLLVE